MKNNILAGLAVCSVFFSLNAHAGEVEIIKAEARLLSSGAYRFDVTLRHDDTGWDHYADRWEVIAPDGSILGQRVLLHPHVNEQPFTRSLSGIKIPDTTKEVVIRAHDTVHGMGKQVLKYKLPNR